MLPNNSITKSMSAFDQDKKAEPIYNQVIVEEDESCHSGDVDS